MSYITQIIGISNKKEYLERILVGLYHAPNFLSKIQIREIKHNGDKFGTTFMFAASINYFQDRVLLAAWIKNIIHVEPCDFYVVHIIPESEEIFTISSRKY